MMSEAVGRPFVKRVLLAAAVAALVPWAAPAADAGTAAHEAAPAVSAPDASPPSRGVVITWSSANRRFESPARDEAARLVSELQRLLAGGLADTVGLATGAPIATRTKGGLLKARMPAGLVDLALVRVDADGTFAGSCTQGPADALRTLSQAPARPAER